mmetsp:Transcript_94043/g.275246  ORF Transcript_94043/g.275246 Transcript_94043/m.275246 type:complete len:224 (+) Transcript_94043:191-862(+)
MNSLSFDQVTPHLPSQPFSGLAGSASGLAVASAQPLQNSVLWDAGASARAASSERSPEVGSRVPESPPSVLRSGALKACQFCTLRQYDGSCWDLQPPRLKGPMLSKSVLRSSPGSVGWSFQPSCRSFMAYCSRTLGTPTLSFALGLSKYSRPPVWTSWFSLENMTWCSVSQSGLPTSLALAVEELLAPTSFLPTSMDRRGSQSLGGAGVFFGLGEGLLLGISK